MTQYLSETQTQIMQLTFTIQHKPNDSLEQIQTHTHTVPRQTQLQRIKADFHRVQCHHDETSWK